MEWSKELTLEFIDLYKLKETLWNPKYKFYYHKNKKSDAWNELASEIGQPVDQCRKKIENLLAQFRREKMKMKKSETTGKGRDEVYRSSWFAFESMAFLLDKNVPRDTLSNSLRENDIYPEEDEDGSLEEREQIMSEQLQSQKSGPPSKKQKKSTDPRLDKAFELLTACAGKDDECQHFGNMIAAKLRKFDEAVQCDIQNDILQIFSKASKGFYNTNHSTSYNLNQSTSYNPLLLNPQFPSPYYSPSSLYAQTHSPMYSSSHSVSSVPSLTKNDSSVATPNSKITEDLSLPSFSENNYAPSTI